MHVLLIIYICCFADRLGSTMRVIKLGSTPKLGFQETHYPDPCVDRNSKPAPINW